MPPLAELQRDFTRALLAGGAVPASIRGILSPREAMRVHRNTAIGALAGALRLSHPSVDVLVGEAFFDQAAAAFVQAHPPRAAALGLYGEGFAEFLAGLAPSLPYLADMARLDFAIERALQGAGGTRQFALEATLAIALPESLAVLALHYRVDEIRAALGDDAALAAIRLDPVEHHVLVWRQDDQARMRAVSAWTGRFLHALLAGSPAPEALAAAGPDQAATVARLQAELFAAPFCTIIAKPEGLSP